RGPPGSGYSTCSSAPGWTSEGTSTGPRLPRTTWRGWPAMSGTAPGPTASTRVSAPTLAGTRHSPGSPDTTWMTGPTPDTSAWSATWQPTRRTSTDCATVGGSPPGRPPTSA